MLPTITILGVTLPSFGLMMLCGMISAFLLIFYNIKTTIINEDDFYSVAIIAIICGLVGSKILYWIVEWRRVVANPHFLLETLNSGFVFYGALILGTLGVWVFCRKKKQPLLRYADLISPSFAIGQTFGRVGCFLAGCCYGAPTDGPLGVIYPNDPETLAPAGVALLPTQLMESAFLFLLAALLTLLFRKRKMRGTTTSWYFILYGVWRFIIEFFRSDDRGTILGLSTSQFIGIFVVLCGVAILIFYRRPDVRPGFIPGASVSRETSDPDKNTIIEVVREHGSGSAPVIKSKDHHLRFHRKDKE